MLMSAREACAALSSLGLSRGQGQRVLAAGLAGDPIRTRSALLYDERQVRALVERPTISWPEVHELCAAGVFVSRRVIDPTRSPAEQIEALSSGWGSVSPWSWWELGCQIRAHGSIAFVATVAGFVVCGGDIVGLRDGSRLLLEPPGEWFGSFVGHRFPSGPGRPWVLRLGTLRLGQHAAT
jgi:hypothetical protein